MPNKFITPYGLQTPPLKYVLQWKLGSLFKHKRVKSKDDDFKLTVRELEAKDLESNDDFIVWLGHATFLIQLNGTRILTDPVFGSVPLVPRLAKFPTSIEHLKPDIICISHGHYDHLDLDSLKQLDIYAKETKIIMPTNLSKYLKKGANVTELGWYEESYHDSVKITALPASHWHRRGVFDFNRALWCSFLIEVEGKSIFFAGDTAMDKHFDEIVQKGYKIETALMPVGAYLPESVMKQSHMNPDEAVQGTKILGAKKMIPYHYGTFNLSDEPIGEPHSWITHLAKTENLDIKVVEVGEII